MEIEMFSKDNCPQCVSAEQWLTNQGLFVATLKLDKDFDREALFEHFPRARSYPQFKLNGTPVGDFATLQARIAFEQECAF
ncbi:MULTISPECIES: glutaredoxin family protein [Vibrio]|uniref:glutaredoxin family protein n=1 Tax=Vibrio TaxID=662 RepID=UPI0021A663AC|nr:MULTISPECIES: glutaredoxin domain-containing protein [Vibrio]MDA0149074.1 glutaredoxin [Vibrio sp. LaRot3]